MKLRVTLMHESHWTCSKLESKRVICKFYYFKYYLQVKIYVGHILQLSDKYQCSIKLFETSDTDNNARDFACQISLVDKDPKGSTPEAGHFFL